MSQLLNKGLAVGLCLAMISGAVASRAQSPTTMPPNVIAPPLSFPRAQYLHSHPQAWSEFASGLPRLPAGPPVPSRPLSGTVRRGFTGGSWSAIATAPSAGLCNPLLLTDATVIVHVCNTPSWYRLRPDKKGNYATGKWSKIASLPIISKTKYAPQYNASAVLPDGRAIIMGGEYNGNNTEVWTNLGAIYDPVANRWKAVTAPTGPSWSQIGDAQSVVLANGTLMLASCCADPAADALLDPTTLTWTSTGAPIAGFNYQDEQGYELLPSGNVLTIDIWTNYATHGNATNAEQYSPTAGLWSSAGNTPASLPDPAACGNYEIGPAVLRGDGRLIAFGGNTGCVAGATSDPTAIFYTPTEKWTAGPNIPAVCGGASTTSCDLADAPAALLPDGNILFAASAGFGTSPTHFFEFTLKNLINQVSDTLYYANTSGAYYYNFLDLPSGQVLATDFSNTPELYTAVGAPLTSWAPVISTVPTSLTRGTVYTVTGSQLNGRSQGAAYGDDEQAATNYPIIRVTNTATGDVSYGRSYGFSGVSVAPNGHNESAQFVLPSSTETGASTLSVIADGIASKPKAVTVN